MYYIKNKSTHLIQNNIYKSEESEPRHITLPPLLKIFPSNWNILLVASNSSTMIPILQKNPSTSTSTIIVLILWYTSQWFTVAKIKYCITVSIQRWPLINHIVDYVKPSSLKTIGNNKEIFKNLSRWQVLRQPSIKSKHIPVPLST